MTYPASFEKPIHPKAPISFRHNILPPLLGIMLCLSMIGLFNSQWLVAQAQYRLTQPGPQAVAAISTEAPDPNSVQLQIPSINVKAPVVYDEKSYQDEAVRVALRRGVVHYGNTAMPGQAGNIVVLGHSSGVAWAPGDYKFIFTLLDKLKPGDTILIDYKGTRYVFKVSDSKVVPPTDLSVLKQTSKPQLTLITCTPVGTSKNRLIVTADQVSPKPETATPLTSAELQSIGGNILPAN